MRRVAIGLLLGLMTLPAAAAPARLRGTIETADSAALTIKLRDGQSVTVRLSPNYTVGAVEKASLADIKPDSFVGATAVPGPNGALRALEVHIFPPAGRGTGEGSRDWDLALHSSMTNAAVTGSVANSDGRVLTLTYKGGEKKILVTPGTPIVFNVAGSAADVKPGVGIVILAAEKNADGSYQTGRITVGRNGINPPD